MAGTALRGRLTWQLAELIKTVAETPRVKTIVFDVPGWPGHRAGQHVDVRLTAEDGYQAERSYSIASAPDGTRVALTVQRLEDGEVSPYLTGELRPGDGGTVYQSTVSWPGDLLCRRAGVGLSGRLSSQLLVSRRRASRGSS